MRTIDELISREQEIEALYEEVLGCKKKEIKKVAKRDSAC